VIRYGVKLSNLHKIEKYVKENRGEIGKIIEKSGKIGTFT